MTLVTKLEARANHKLACRYVGRFGLLRFAPPPLLRRLTAQLHARRARWLSHSCGENQPHWDLIDLFYARASSRSSRDLA